MHAYCFVYLLSQYLLLSLHYFVSFRLALSTVPHHTLVSHKPFMFACLSLSSAVSSIATEKEREIFIKEILQLLAITLAVTI